MTKELVIRNMTRPEVDELVGWAASEGWNPGLDDAECFWATDPDAFIAAELAGALIGGGAITVYQGDFGFMGFFIVRPEFRGRWLGTTLWRACRERLLARLRPRATFLKRWLSQPHAVALGCRRDGDLSGYGVVRRCGQGRKIGPLFADDIQAAQALYARLAESAAGGPVFLDAPENNPAALELVRRHRMVEVFGCARMYLGPAPAIAHRRIFGATTFELG